MILSKNLSTFCFLYALCFSLAYAATFVITNNCPYTIWAGAVPGGGMQLNQGGSWTLDVSPGTKEARIWPRTGCNFDGAGRGNCQTGDCGGLLQCQAYGAPPNTLAEYALNQFNNLDFFDISLVDGFNVPIEFSPTSNGCTRGIKCTADINGQCPNELKAPGGCNNPCTVFKTDQYCCNSGSCEPTNYSKFFKDRCPNAYSYPKDDNTSKSVRLRVKRERERERSVGFTERHRMREPQGAVGIESNNYATSPPQALLERLKDYGQEDAFALWDELSPEERDLLVKEIENLDLPRIDRIIRCSVQSQGLPAAAIEPVPESSVSTVEERTLEQRERWWKMGLKAISDGKLAVLLLSGGQGTRLGSSDPKGCFNIGLPSGKSLFQLQAERILCVQRLAAQATSEASAGSVQIHWYIMTSPFTDDATRKFFESHKFFGLEADQVTFFQQGTIPCVSKDGRFIMETPYKVSKAPDGNGGVYSALKSSRLLEDMATRGIKYLDCYGVDNALVRVADPTFLGYFIDKGVAAAAKVVRKAYPQEKVGVFVRRGKGGPLTVVEYSELDSSLASAINQQTGRLRFCWSNVCLHMFSLDFLNQVANGLEKDSIYHLAEKKIPSIHGHTMGLKLEQFIFDAFPYAPSTALFEVIREEEFAPVKNANGSNFDTPDSARLLVLRLHSRWVVAAGGFLTHSVPLYATGVEVSPLCSYAGENLEAICRGRTFHAPCEISF